MQDSDRLNNMLASFQYAGFCHEEDQVSWKSYFIIANDWGYSCSASISDRYERVRAPYPEAQRVIDVSLDRLESESLFSCKVQNLVLQWNPSLVVATQSFLGRTRKRLVSMMKARAISSNESIETNTVVNDPTDTVRSFSLEAYCGSITVCLNKEHQSRRLLWLKF
jgi:hypothetical protein